MSIHGRRKRSALPRPINVRRTSKIECEIARAQHPETNHQKPRSRAECVNGPRPCPFVSCRHHLYIDVSPTTGSIKLNFPDLEVWELGETCSLDIADRGGVTLETVSSVLSVTRERVRQLEVAALIEFEARAGQLREDAGAIGEPKPTKAPRVPHTSMRVLATVTTHGSLTAAELRTKMLGVIDALGITQVAVAQELGVTQPGFNRWLRRARERDIRSRVTVLVAQWLDAHPIDARRFHNGTPAGSIMDHGPTTPARATRTEEITTRPAA